MDIDNLLSAAAIIISLVALIHSYYLEKKTHVHSMKEKYIQLISELETIRLILNAKGELLSMAKFPLELKLSLKKELLSPLKEQGEVIVRMLGDYQRKVNKKKYTDDDFLDLQAAMGQVHVIKQTSDLLIAELDKWINNASKENSSR